MSMFWTPQVNAFLGSAVVTVGAWLAWDQLSLFGTALLFVSLAGFLIWQGKTLGIIWAWSTLFLGLESLIWPILVMARNWSATAEPSDEEMSIMLSSLLMGLFSAVFWLTFSYGLFKRTRLTGIASANSTDKVASDCSRTNG